MERKIRNSAKALIIRDGMMLASKINDNGDIFYIMPGGGQDEEELLPEAVKRECTEEMGILVEPKSLVFVIEGLHGESFHRVDLVFLCDYVGTMVIYSRIIISTAISVEASFADNSTI